MFPLENPLILLALIALNGFSNLVPSEFCLEDKQKMNVINKQTNRMLSIDVTSNLVSTLALLTGSSVFQYSYNVIIISRTYCRTGWIDSRNPHVV